LTQVTDPHPKVFGVDYKFNLEDAIGLGQNRFDHLLKPIVVKLGFNRRQTLIYCMIKHQSLRVFHETLADLADLS
jgi:hypothetical protein